MSKQITFNYDDVTYTLEFTKNTVRQMENSGFRTSDVDDRIMNSLPELFAGAFRAHHRLVDRKKIDEIWETIPNKADLVEKLADMYNEPIRELLSEPKAKKTEWTVNW